MSGYGAEAVYGEACEQHGFSHARWQKGSKAFDRWMDDGRYSETRRRLGEGDESARAQAISEIKGEYGNPILVWIGGAFVSWLIGRLLDMWFPRGQGAAECSD